MKRTISLIQHCLGVQELVPAADIIVMLHFNSWTNPLLHFTMYIVWESFSTDTFDTFLISQACNWYQICLHTGHLTILPYRACKHWFHDTCTRVQLLELPTNEPRSSRHSHSRDLKHYCLTLQSHRQAFWGYFCSVCFSNSRTRHFFQAKQCFGPVYNIHRQQLLATTTSSSTIVVTNVYARKECYMFQHGV